MPFSAAFALPSGNAVQLLLNPPKGADSWRLLRRPSPAFAGPDDPAATLVADECREREVLDILGLQNGIPYHYRVYYRAPGGGWLAVDDTATVTPAAAYRGDDLDVQLLLRDRLELGLAIEVQRGRLKPPPRIGRFEVLLAPFMLSDNAAFPAVSVHHNTSAPAVRGIGERIRPDARQSSGGWTETEGWLQRVVLNIAAVTPNPGERVALRLGIRRIVLANLPILDALGVMLPEFSQQDVEDHERFNVPLFFSLGTFTCLAPAYAETDLGQIEDVSVSLLDLSP